MSDKPFDKWSCSQLLDWLQENGLPVAVCDVFEDEVVDGAAFLDLTEEDVKTLIKPIGYVKRLVRLIKSKSEVFTEEQPPVPKEGVNLPDFDSPGSSNPKSPSLFSKSSTRSCDYEGSCDTSVHSMTPIIRDGIPIAYTLPKAFSSTVMGALQKKEMEAKIRSAFVRELLVHMTSYGSRPSLNFCSLVARRIVLKYPFLRDSIGNGYASWEKRIVGRVYNVYKGEKRKLEDGAAVSEKKRAKITDRYPPLALSDVSDEATNSRNREALNKELSKKNPIKSTILELMELTYGCRREYIVNEARSVHEILEKYPALSRPDVIIQEMELVLKRPKGSLLDNFQQRWQKWVPTILKVSETFSKKSIAALKEPPNYGLEADHLNQIRAVWCLAAMFTTVAKKDKEKHPEYYWIEDYCMAECPELSASEQPARNSPRIARFQSLDTRADYYVFIEQKVFLKVTSFTLALFVWFASHYVFNLEYHKYYQNGAMFLQEMVFELPEADQKKKKQCYLTTVTELHRLFTV